MPIALSEGSILDRFMSVFVVKMIKMMKSKPKGLDLISAYADGT